MPASDSPILFLVGVLVVAVLLGFVLALVKKGNKKLDVEKYQSDWLSIQQSVTKDSGSWQLAVLKADKLLDRALKDSGYKGSTMGERMVSAGRTFSKRDRVWAAHKLRNRIAHEDDIRITENLTKQALASFKHALKDLGAL